MPDKAMPDKAVQGGRSHPAGPTWRLAASLHRLLLLVPPLLLARLEIFHPSRRSTLRPSWTHPHGSPPSSFHVIQLALIGLVGMSVLLLADSFGCATAWPTCMGAGIFRLLAAQESQAHSTARHRRDGHGTSSTRRLLQLLDSARRPRHGLATPRSSTRLLKRCCCATAPSRSTQATRRTTNTRSTSRTSGATTPRSPGPRGSNETQSPSLVAEH